MALTYYDDAVVAKLSRWTPTNSKLRILKPDETRRLIETTADDKKDKPLKLPMIALSRNLDIELLETSKSLRSFSGLAVQKTNDLTVQMNVLPVKIEYQLDIYTKTYDEGDELLREFLFKLINNPLIKIEIPYNDAHIEHVANIRVAPNVSDTSAISERLFPGQFTRWTIHFEIQDAFLFNIPYKNNWKIIVDDVDEDLSAELEIYNKQGFKQLEESESLHFNIKK